METMKGLINVDFGECRPRRSPEHRQTFGKVNVSSPCMVGTRHRTTRLETLSPHAVLHGGWLSFVGWEQEKRLSNDQAGMWGA